MSLEANIQEIVIKNEDGQEFKILGTIFDFYIIGIGGNLYTVTKDCLNEILAPGETIEHIQQGVNNQIKGIIANGEPIKYIDELKTYIYDRDENND